ncbi:adenine phosphoribosyltransferase [Schnuerera sp. xch1]|uniref:adenine phosphoribosyltransferase n=1 Tax=Schnuerera sp. xch1 TaxID=2874283 RepID=UPI001CBB9A18|nr:adenine phosphoribosyltransferase [Schnuerera sp. xch1]MBZ2174403.1 adenine phosphoribosyltransferase [Schnuerera sp. xch1]
MDLKSKIRVIEDFPEKGVSFKDITTLIKDNNAFVEAVNLLAKDLKDKDIDYIAGPEARGFLFGATVAYALGVGFIPVRKPGKLPADVVSYEYELEYGSNTLEIHKDAIGRGKRVAIVDDLLATGGTVMSTAKLIESAGGEVVAMEFLIELESLKGREKLKDYYINSLVKYER